MKRISDAPSPSGPPAVGMSRHASTADITAYLRTCLDEGKVLVVAVLAPDGLEELQVFGPPDLDPAVLVHQAATFLVETLTGEQVDNDGPERPH